MLGTLLVFCVKNLISLGISGLPGFAAYISLRQKFRDSVIRLKWTFERTFPSIGRIE